MPWLPFDGSICRPLSRLSESWSFGLATTTSVARIAIRSMPWAPSCAASCSSSEWYAASFAVPSENSTREVPSICAAAMNALVSKSKNPIIPMRLPRSGSLITMRRGAHPAAGSHSTAAGGQTRRDVGGAGLRVVREQERAVEREEGLVLRRSLVDRRLLRADREGEFARSDVRADLALAQDVLERVLPRAVLEGVGLDDGARDDRVAGAGGADAARAEESGPDRVPVGRGDRVLTGRLAAQVERELHSVVGVGRAREVTAVVGVGRDGLRAQRLVRRSS